MNESIPPAGKPAGPGETAKFQSIADRVPTTLAGRPENLSAIDGPAGAPSSRHLAAGSGFKTGRQISAEDVERRVVRSSLGQPGRIAPKSKLPIATG